MDHQNNSASNFDFCCCLWLTYFLLKQSVAGILDFEFICLVQIQNKLKMKRLR